jgi:glycosyltransferase involved in cell wall biosynthesis
MSVSISVVLCSRNGAQFVEEQFLSILAQDVPPNEIIVSDDASTDETLEIIKSAFVNARVRFPDVRLILLRNPTALGVVGNFESALRVASGNLIALSDQDDVWIPSKLRALAGRFAGEPSLLLVHSDARLVDENGISLGTTLFSTLRIGASALARERREGGLSELMKRNVVTGATTMIKREILDFAGEFPRSWVHDEWLAVIAAAVGRIDYDARQLIDYRQHETNQIGVRQLDLRGRLRKLTMARLQRNARLLERAEDLVRHLGTIRRIIHADALQNAEEKLRHERVRSSLSPHPLLRLGPVSREVLSGRYFSCGLGIQDIVRDLVQPGGEPS